MVSSKDEVGSKISPRISLPVGFAFNLSYPPILLRFTESHGACYNLTMIMINRTFLVVSHQMKDKTRVLQKKKNI